MSDDEHQQLLVREKRSTLWGRFCSLAQARERAGGLEWWTSKDHLGRGVDLTKPLEGVPDMNYPVFISDEGWMYVGEWFERNGDWIEHGFGCSLSCVEGSSYQGLMFVGQYKMGERHGSGKRWWLPGSKAWQANAVKYSPLLDPTTHKPIPFNYEGDFHYNDYYAENAVVELRDGTKRKGEWKHGQPHGNFFQDHEVVC